MKKAIRTASRPNALQELPIDAEFIDSIVRIYRDRAPEQTTSEVVIMTVVHSEYGGFSVVIVRVLVMSQQCH